MKILYLYAELVGYQIPIFEVYVKKYFGEVHVISWDKKKLKPYIPPKINKVTYYHRSEYSNNQLLILATKIDPDIIYISGWMDKGYMYIVKFFRKKGINVVTAFDDKWKGTLRQKVGSLYFKITLKSLYSHAWVTGPYQYEYAKKFGFKNENIIYDMLSGNSDLFNQGMSYLEGKKKCFPKAFLYVGNFRHVKGTDILVEAFKKYRREYNGDWKLICVGNGDYKCLLEGDPDIEIICFSAQETLVKLTEKSGVFILPSRQDQWGVVVHEFAAAGMPLILSTGVGALPTFFIEGFNGLSYSNNSIEGLATAMSRMSSKSVEDLITWAENSHLLSTRISPETSAANFMSLVK
jgi:glycosyltransferase involved in cell wall biosynthesis